MGKQFILYSTGCPKCKILKVKLDKLGIEYTTIEDVDLMQEKGFKEVPKLEVDGIVYSFKDAVDWLKEQ